VPRPVVTTASHLVPVALVTGAGSGIGRATAIELAGRGYTVALLDRDEHGIAETEALITTVGGQVEQLSCDVTDASRVVAVLAAFTDRYDRLDAVAACAGIEVLGDILTLEETDWRRALDVNATGVFNIAKHSMPYLLDGGGAFVAVASDAGVAGAQGYSAYAASKHAVVGLIRCMALDFGPRGVRSNVVCPAFVETPMADRIFAASPSEDHDFYQAIVPLGRFAMAREVAQVIAHLVSAEASYTNGLVYNVDGGSTAGYYRPATVSNM
jgi:meso-butanediol dehydrogenase / (S,S)-butanediol dehydrogenase / diacetyl reductase